MQSNALELSRVVPATAALLSGFLPLVSARTQLISLSRVLFVVMCVCLQECDSRFVAY